MPPLQAASDWTDGGLPSRNRHSSRSREVPEQREGIGVQTLPDLGLAALSWNSTPLRCQEMRRRIHRLALSLAVLATACGQSAPARPPLPEIPEDLAIPVIVDDPIPDNGSCVLVVGEGARVLSIDESFSTGEALLVGDIITGVAGTPVASSQTLIAELRSYRPGEVVTLDIERDGASRQDDVILGSHPEDSGAAVLGVRVDTALRGHAPNAIPQGDLAPERAHLLAVAGSLYFHDPVAAAWQSVGAPSPLGSVVALDGRLFAVTSSGSGLAPVGGGAEIPLPTSGRLIVNVLGVLDGLLVAGLAELSDTSPDVTSAAVAGIDISANEVVWEWDPGLLNGQVVQPILGSTAPSEGVLAIPSLVGDLRLHSLLDTTGSVVAGWGTETPFLPARTVVAGWYDQSNLAFVARSEDQLTLNLVLVDVDDFSYTHLRVLDRNELLFQVWAVGDGTNVVINAESESKLFDIGAQTPGRLVTRACDVREIADPTVLRSGLSS